jgi:ribulose-5-phosphate 4-epimerase/fuculose-1-phosphate aldolase
MQEEGVIKFDLDFSNATPVPPEMLRELNAWRKILWQLELIGQDPQRYGGYGFGNVSQRLAPFDAAPGQRAFVISGTQTGGRATLDASAYCSVTAYDPQRNRVVAEGPVRPSSESLTHAMIYALDAGIRVILHVHSADIWQHAETLHLPVTDPTVAYGTPAMALEVERLFRETVVRKKGIFSMGGHEDGIVAFGATTEAAGRRLVSHLAMAYTVI